MGWESFGVVRFDLSRPQGQMRIAKFTSAYNSFSLCPTGLNVKLTYRKLWATNLLMLSDLTLDPSFKVK